MRYAMSEYRKATSKIIFPVRIKQIDTPLAQLIGLAMAGYYEMKGKQGCWEDWFDGVNTSQNDYVLNKNYWMRPGVTRCRDNALGTTCSFYGPKTVPRTTQESFLQGRGQVQNDHCPQCDVIVLPESVFDLTKDEEKTCQDMSLQPQHTRQPKSCGTLAETEISTYAFLPGAFQRGYQGVSSLCDTGLNIQGREDARSQYRAPPRTMAEKQTNYGNYRSSAPAAYE
jgi:hypothetical protein